MPIEEDKIELGLVYLRRVFGLSCQNLSFGLTTYCYGVQLEHVGVSLNAFKDMFDIVTYDKSRIGQMDVAIPNWVTAYVS